MAKGFVCKNCKDMRLCAVQKCPEGYAFMQEENKRRMEGYAKLEQAKTGSKRK